MFELRTTIPFDLITNSQNLVPLMAEDEAAGLGREVVELFEMDRMSRDGWETKMERAGKIALQVMEQKVFPWVGASNVKFPLLTIACLQYHSRAYPALIDAPDLVKCAPLGNDPQGSKTQSADRIAEHMSWQNLEEDEDWEAEHDKLLLVTPLMGCAFIKKRFNAALRHSVSECVLPQDLVVSYFAKSIDSADRATHILNWQHNDLVSRMNQGIIIETDLGSPKVMPIPFGLLREMRDKAQGTVMPSQDPTQSFIILEQLCWYDLDGDGYKEPYVATVRFDNRQLLRLVPRFIDTPDTVIRNGDAIVCITPERFYTKYGFIPSPDGGFYDLGFGSLLGPLNESIDTTINQLFDTGTLKNAGGGFLGRGARIKRGENALRPGTFITVDSTGDDLRKNMVPFPLSEPSPVLMQLLTFLVEYGQRVAGAPDIVQGQNPGQNTPAETSRTMLEQGIQVFNGIYKRAYRSLKEEYRKQYRLNQLHLQETQEFASVKSGLPMKALVEDYKMPSSAIMPVADPHYMSGAQRMNQANALLTIAQHTPGFDINKATMFYLKAWKIPAAESYIPMGPDGKPLIPPKPDPKLELEKLRLQGKQMELQMNMKMKLFQLLEEHDLNRAKILEMETHAALEAAQASGISTGHQIAQFEAAIGAAKLVQEGRMQSIKLLRELIEATKETESGQGSIQGVEAKRSNEGSPGMASQPTPALAGIMGSGPVH